VKHRRIPGSSPDRQAELLTEFLERYDASETKTAIELFLNGLACVGPEPPSEKAA
jgi:hypothetical protein